MLAFMGRNISKSDRDCADRLMRLWRLRARKMGLTQQQAAEDMGITQGAVWQYLHGRIALNIPAALRFARLLDVDPSEILGDDWIKKSAAAAPQQDHPHADLLDLLDWLSDDEIDQLRSDLESKRQQRRQIFERIKSK